MANNTLYFQRKATKARDSANGLLYIYRWNTGYQQLIFQNEASVEHFAKATKATVKHAPKPKQKIRRKPNGVQS